MAQIPLEINMQKEKEIKCQGMVQKEKETLLLLKPWSVAYNVHRGDYFRA